MRFPSINHISRRCNVSDVDFVIWNDADCFHVIVAANDHSIFGMTQTFLDIVTTVDHLSITVNQLAIHTHQH
jgi:hypothetical protein